MPDLPRPDPDPQPGQEIALSAAGDLHVTLRELAEVARDLCGADSVLLSLPVHTDVLVGRPLDMGRIRAELGRLPPDTQHAEQPTGARPGGRAVIQRIALPGGAPAGWLVAVGAPTRPAGTNGRLQRLARAAGAALALAGTHPAAHSHAAYDGGTLDPGAAPLKDADLFQDTLTGLGNREAFDLDLEHLVRTGSATEVQLLLLDIDELGEINERQGRDHGDRLLIAYATELRRLFGEDDRIYRLGGDEFAVLIEHVTLAPQTVLEQARRAASDLRVRGYGEVGVSVGVATHPSDAHAPNDLRRLADQRMLRDKAARRTRRNLAQLQPQAANTAGAAPAAAQDLAWHALRATLSVLGADGELDDDGWQALLDAAVAAVPGAETGVLHVRAGGGFVLRAQSGFSDALIGVRQPVAAALAWFGTHEQGRLARILSGTAIAERSRSITPPAPGEPLSVYEAHGDLHRLRANLCAQVMLDGEIAAQLNLDSTRSEYAFDESSVHAVQEFAVQLEAILTASARRAREAQRQLELECLVSVSSALHDVRSPEAAEQVLLQQAIALTGCAHAVLLRYEPRRDGLEVRCTEGFYRDLSGHLLPRGVGLAWSALSTGSVQRVTNAALDRRVHRPAQMPDGAVMAAPLLSADGEPLGALLVSHTRPLAFTDLEARLFGAVASAGATAVERILAERGQRQRTQELQMLAQLGTLGGVLDDPDHVARRCLRACRASLGADLAVFQTATSIVTEHAHTDLDPAELFASSFFDPQDLQGMWEGTGGCLARGPGVGADPDADGPLDRAGVHAGLFVPVLERGVIVGVVGFCWREGQQELPSATRALAERVAELVGQCLERGAFVAAIEATTEGALYALGLALELRDFETAGHTARVVDLATRLGRAAGVGGEALEALRQGGYLHDIGKLAVPDRILLKEGPLDALEWTLMRAHAEIGDALTARVPTLRPMARQVIRHHHERWDGGGYPDGLSGERIPLLARVFAVVDAYDAMLSARPYKGAWTREEALLELQAQAGRQFDPELVRMMVGLLEGEGR